MAIHIVKYWVNFLQRPSVLLRQSVTSMVFCNVIQQHKVCISYSGGVAGSGDWWRRLRYWPSISRCHGANC